MYQPYPGSAEMPVVERKPLPSSMLTAVRVMYAGAASSLIGILVDVLTVGDTKNEIARHSTTMTASQLSSTEHVLVAAFIAGGVIGAAVWVFLARSCKDGKPWARIVATVLFGLATVDTLVGITAPLAAAAKGYAAVVWLIGLVAIVFLWRGTSSAYFSRASR
ncbi:MAG TPA: hypothetical protein VFB06_02255 [Streptosporangiaceae bacterium]|nr:hypothetical protein [Streptosporangiaceae bacterium]